MSTYLGGSQGEADDSHLQRRRIRARVDQTPTRRAFLEPLEYRRL